MLLSSKVDYKIQLDVEMKQISKLKPLKRKKKMFFVLVWRKYSEEKEKFWQGNLKSCDLQYSPNCDYWPQSIWLQFLTEISGSSL